jgi:hypothetical protein
VLKVKRVRAGLAQPFLQVGDGVLQLTHRGRVLSLLTPLRIQGEPLMTSFDKTLGLVVEFVVDVPPHR